MAIPPYPRNAPPPIPTEPRIVPPPPRAAGQPPNKYVVTYKGPERGDAKAMPTSSSTWNRLTKGTKSMENLRGHALGLHPVNLQPGGGRNTHLPPLPVTRRGDPMLPAGTPTSALGTVKSYDGRTIRPPPIQGSQFQTGFGSNLNSDADYGRSPRAPTHPFLTLFNPYRSSTRPNDVQHSDHHSDPLRSPVSPRSPRFTPNPHSRDQQPESASSDTPGPPEITTTDAGLLEERRWAEGLFAESERESATLVPMSETRTFMPETRTFMPETRTFVPSTSGTMTSTRSGASFDSDSDDSDTGMWKKPSTAEQPKSILHAGQAHRPTLTVQTNPKLLEKAAQLHPTFASGSTPASQQRPHSPSAKSSSTREVTAREEDTRAPRPPLEDVYEQLEVFFPEHDLDKPVIEMISGETSPTGTTSTDQTLVPVPPTPAPEKSRIREKKSIRLVAQERKRYIGGDALTAIQRKQSTKLWGSKVEEVDTSSLIELPSPSEGATTFKWLRGELIGRGSYGRVYLALNAMTGEMMAVKQVEIPRTASHKNDSGQVTVVQAFKLESETLKVLDHPNIVQYLGFEETPTNLSIFMEYVPGGSISSCLLKHGRFDEDVTKSFTLQILAGLEYLHSKGILHRDLKSDNILVEMSGVCKISDFGFSKRTDDQNNAHTAMQGTVFWMAPEVINTQKNGYSFKIDIWSIGCVVLEMWTGTRPWLGEETITVMLKLFHSKLPPPVPDDLVLSPLADDFRKKCFAINPEERPSAAELRRHPYLTPSLGWVFDGFATKS